MPHPLTYLLLPLLLFSCSQKPKSESEAVATKPKAQLSVRNAHSMAWNSNDGRVYLFGGANEKQVLADLWVYEKGSWQSLEVEPGPQPRTFAAFTYDPSNDWFILFGGSKVLFGSAANANNMLNDTWQLKNGKWEQIETTNAPTPRAEAVAVYNPKSERTVLFGGYTIQGDQYIKLGDTWEFYDNDWHLASESGPSERHGVAMAYDPQQQAVVLFGGSTVDKQYGESQGETWVWGNGAWQKLDIEQPPGVFNAAMVYDLKNRELIRFGGWNGETRIDETWVFQDGGWKMLELETRPAARNHATMVYDRKRQVAVLFGGHDGKRVFGDIWEYADGKWVQVSEVEPLERVRNGH
ncbi:MAG: kelch repeat-containing protein [Cyclobacteriaceae bacterium]